jgi:hypothetical protein
VLPVLTLAFWGCAPAPESTPALGSAYVGSIHLKVYAELAPQAAVTGELPFGQRVDLLRRRRNFYLVRNPDGVEGWTHRSGLFNERQVSEVNALARLAAESPAQGEATVYSPLNAHNHPNRLAPSIFQIQEGDVVKVIAHERHPRAPFDAGPLLDGASGRASTSRPNTDQEPEEEIQPPTPPPPPEPPPAWMRLSGLSAERILQLEAEGVVDEHRSTIPRASGDLWSLVRNAEGLAGWALHARLSPAIPERVLQYAEGARVTSYFSLGQANSAGTAHHWLWTTLSSNDVAFPFDSFRVFTWNNRLSRYETALIQRGVEGYLPVEVSPQEGGLVRFRIAVRERQGILHRKTYELNGLRVRLVQSVPWPNFDPLKQPPIMQRLPEPAFDGRPTPIPQLTFWDRVLQSPGRLWRSLGGG